MNIIRPERKKIYQKIPGDSIFSNHNHFIVRNTVKVRIMAKNPLDSLLVECLQEKYILLVFQAFNDGINPGVTAAHS